MIKYYKIFFKLSLIVFIIACINTFTHATVVDGKPSANERTQRISNGDFEYSYRHGQLDTGKKHFGYGGSNAYSINIEFGNNYLQEFNVILSTFDMYASTYRIHLPCENIYKNPEDCNVRNIYKQDQNFEKHPELKKNDSVDINAFIESKVDSDGMYRNNFDLFTDIVGLHLKANHFSDDFIRRVMLAAKERGDYRPTEEEKEKSMRKLKKMFDDFYNNEY